MVDVRCDECGTPMVRFEDETFSVTHDGRTTEVPHLSGWKCPHGHDAIFDAGSAEAYAAAGDALVQAARKRDGEELRRIRKHLGLTQEQAAKLTGGGHNAFSRYERGEVPPMPAVLNLFRLLDKHPDLLPELAGQGTGNTQAAA